MTEARDFWTRRKAAVTAEAEAVTAAQRDAAKVEERDRLDSLTDAEILEKLNLPEPESLVAGDDFSAFMSHAVPDRLRRRALRTLWRSNPVLANIDGLVDYGDDFTDGATVVENLQTAYSVGRGMLAHVEWLARSKPEAPAEDAAEPELPPNPDPEARVLAWTDTAQHMGEEDDMPATPSPRRMTFTYESETG